MDLDNTTGITKFAPFILKTMPFSAGKDRKDILNVKGKWGEKKVQYVADEMLNGYDLITLAQVAQHFQKKEFKQQIINFKNSKIKVFELEFKMKEMLFERGVKNDLKARKTLLESFSRLFSLHYKIIDGNKKISSHFIYRTEEDIKGYSNITILAEENFINVCQEFGILLNFERLCKYGRKNYAILLDAYLQATKESTKGFPYKKTYKNEDLLKVLGLEKQRKDKQMTHLKGAFAELYKNGNLPKYVYVKFENKWIREDYLLKLKH